MVDHGSEGENHACKKGREKDPIEKRGRKEGERKVCVCLSQSDSMCVKDASRERDLPVKLSV